MATKLQDPEPKRIHAHDVFDVMQAAKLLSYAKRDPADIAAAIKRARAVFTKAEKLKVSK